MKVLSDENKIIDIDVIRHGFHYSILSFKDFKNPDFYFEPVTGLELIECSSASLTIGEFNLMVPIPWCILVIDYDLGLIECLPIIDLLGKKIFAFGINPIDGFRIEYPEIKLNMIYQSMSFLIPTLSNKDMLTVPLGYKEKKKLDKDGNEKTVGPLCVILSPSKLEVNRHISDIW